MKITGEQIFQVKNGNFDIGFSASGYTLYNGPEPDVARMSAANDATPANEVHNVRGAVPGSFYCLVGNVGPVFISW